MSEDAAPGYWVECDGCGDEIASHDALEHQAHDVQFCSRACLNRWQNHMMAAQQ